ncbi:MAG: hypothetical protein KIT80_06030 [Chitinophagaceae bacterium]|nr:hypothetical protein [Chitinophagaceae bacterium]MCW5926452.1 hypothetical protein [Chitinophagaceae bacterium]
MNCTKLFYGILLGACMIFCISCGAGSQGNQLAEDQISSNTDTSIVQPGSDGSFLLSAENGKAIGPNIKYMPEWKAFGWFSNTDLVEWQVNVKKEGSYNAELEWSVSDEEAGKEFVLETQTGKLTGLVERSGSWETYKTKEIGFIKLDPGKQKIVFKPYKDFDSTGALLDLRSIKLTPAVK